MVKNDWEEECGEWNSVRRRALNVLVGSYFWKLCDE